MGHTLSKRLIGFALCSAVLSFCAYLLFFLVWNVLFFYSTLGLVLPWVAALLLHIPAGGVVAQRQQLPCPGWKESLVFLAVVGAAYAGAASFLWNSTLSVSYSLYELVILHINPVMGFLEEAGFLLPFSWYEVLFLPGGFFLTHLISALLPAGLFLTGMVFWRKSWLTRGKTVV